MHSHLRSHILSTNNVILLWLFTSGVTSTASSTSKDTPCSHEQFNEWDCFQTHFVLVLLQKSWSHFIQSLNRYSVARMQKCLLATLKASKPVSWHQSYCVWSAFDELGEVGSTWCARWPFVASYCTVFCVRGGRGHFPVLWQFLVGCYFYLYLFLLYSTLPILWA